MDLSGLDISMVIPAFNEEKRIEATLQSVSDYLRASGRWGIAHPRC